MAEALKRLHNLEPVHLFLSGASAPYVSGPDQTRPDNRQTDHFSNIWEHSETGNEEQKKTIIEKKSLFQHEKGKKIQIVHCGLFIILFSNIYCQNRIIKVSKGINTYNCNMYINA